MKKAFGFLIISSAVSFTACAQKLNESQIPAAAKAAFIKAHPNTKGNWEKEDGNYEVVYKMDSKEMSSVINKTGSILETETELTIKELPQVIQTYISEHYKNSKTKGGAKIVKTDGSINYEATVNGKELMFDNNGGLMKQQKKEKEDEENEGKKRKGGK